MLLVLLLPPPPLPFAVTTTINNTNNNHYQIHCATSTSTLVVLFCLFVLVVLPCVPVLCFVVLTSCLIGVGSGAGRSLPPLCLNCCVSVVVLCFCCSLFCLSVFLLFVDCCVDVCCDRGRLWRRSLTTTPCVWFCCCAVAVLLLLLLLPLTPNITSTTTSMAANDGKQPSIPTWDGQPTGWRRYVKEVNWMVRGTKPSERTLLASRLLPKLTVQTKGW